MHEPSKALTPVERHKLATDPLPTVRRIPGKSWAGALVSNLDEAFGITRLNAEQLRRQLKRGR